MVFSDQKTCSVCLSNDKMNEEICALLPCVLRYILMNLFKFHCFFFIMKQLTQNKAKYWIMILRSIVMKLCSIALHCLDAQMIHDKLQRKLITLSSALLLII